MRDDQYVRFKKLAEDLVEVVIGELNPETWSGAGQTLAEMSKEDRGDRYWAKKNANQTLTIVIKMQALAGMVERANRGSEEQPLTEEGETAADDLDKRMKAAERQAASILKRAHNRADEPKH